MRHVVVRYEVKPECVEEHERLIRDVFEELGANAPEGFAYQVLKPEDGVSFIHVAELVSADNPLQRLGAFKKFTADVESRTVSRPASCTATEIGSYAPRGAGLGP